jgi:hypothetical protein
LILLSAAYIMAKSIGIVVRREFRASGRQNMAPRTQEGHTKPSSLCINTNIYHDPKYIETNLSVLPQGISHQS